MDIKKHFKLFLACIALTLSIVSLGWADNNNTEHKRSAITWHCEASDNEHQSWRDKAPYKQMAQHNALKACKSSSKHPKSCRAPDSHCIMYYKGKSTAPAWECLALDTTGEYWYGYRRPTKDQAIGSAKGLCKSKSKVPHSCYVSISTCQQVNPLADKDKKTMVVKAVALTGPIASGKSTVSQLFTALGVPTISADAFTKQLTMPGSPAYQAIAEHFGDTVIRNDTLDRLALRTIIASNPEEKHWLEQLLHPLIIKRIQETLNTYDNKPVPYVLVEIPLLFDRKQLPFITRVLLLKSPRDAQIERLRARDGVTYEQALSMIQIQSTLEEYNALADDTLTNNGDLDALADSIHQQHDKYLVLFR